MKKLDELILKLERKIPEHELINTVISAASVGWHIEHSLLTLNAIIGALRKSNPDDYKRAFNIKRSIVMLVRKIPRGKAKAPRAVQPANHFDAITLHQHIHLTRENLKTLEQLHAGQFFTHPFLGDFKLKKAVRFLSVHTNHHLCIINDIAGNVAI